MNGAEVVEMQGQAERWFWRLQAPDCSDRDRAACQRWRAERPAHEAAFRQVEDLWRRSLALRQDPELAEELRRVERLSGRHAGGNAWSWRPLAAVAATLLVATVLAFKLREPPAPAGIAYRTAVGEQRTVELPDGSTLVLDTDTALRADYSEGQRLIGLEAGQASFTVARDPTRPFKVRAAGGSVTAVGTRFLVRMEPAATGAAVTLLEGKVVVEGPRGARRHAPATLSPGQQLRFDQAGQWATAQVDLDEASAWTRGSVYARNWRLADLLAEMNRYAATPIRLADPGLAELRISGTFRTGDPQSLVRTLEHSWPVRAAPGEGNEIVLSHRPARK